MNRTDSECSSVKEVLQLVRVQYHATLARHCMTQVSVTYSGELVICIQLVKDKNGQDIRKQQSARCAYYGCDYTCSRYPMHAPGIHVSFTPQISNC